MSAAIRRDALGCPGFQEETRRKINNDEPSARTQRPQNTRVHGCRFRKVMVDAAQVDRIAAIIGETGRIFRSLDNVDLSELLFRGLRPQFAGPLRVQFIRVDTPVRPDAGGGQKHEIAMTSAHFADLLTRRRVE